MMLRQASAKRISQIPVALLRRCYSASAGKKSREGTLSTFAGRPTWIQTTTLLVAGAVTGRYLYGRMITDTKEHPRRDMSRAYVQLRQRSKGEPVPKPITLDREEFRRFLEEQRAIVEQERDKHGSLTQERLLIETEKAMEQAHQRVSDFCDWYLSYATTYKLLAMASSAAAQYAVTPNDGVPLSEFVTLKLSDFIEQKYQAMVLRPAQTDPLLHNGFVSTLQYAHQLVIGTISRLDEAVIDHAQKNGIDDDTVIPQAKNVAMELDWTAQRQKVQHIPEAYSKSPERTLTLVTAGITAGKIVSGAATKSLVGKLVAPFLTSKALAATGGKAVAMASGPVGAVVGVGLDVGANTVAGMWQRPSLEHDVHESLLATTAEWRKSVLQPELERVQGIWYGEVFSLLILRE